MTEKIWSVDGMALSTDYVEDDYLLYGRDIARHIYIKKIKEKGKIKDFITVGVGKNNFPTDTFKTLKRAELERDRREVDYIMKKMACESRDDNDWRQRKDNVYSIEYFHREIYKLKEEFTIVSNSCYVNLNTAYFLTEENAQKCLDYLLKKYTEPRLKEIWGIK